MWNTCNWSDFYQRRMLCFWPFPLLCHFFRSQMQKFVSFGRAISKLWLRSVVQTFISLYRKITSCRCNTEYLKLLLCIPAAGCAHLSESAARSDPHAERGSTKGKGEKTEQPSICWDQLPFLCHPTSRHASVSIKDTRDFCTIADYVYGEEVLL